MKKINYLLSLYLLFSIVFTSCTKNEDDINVPQNVEIQDFVWKGMNFYYLWKDNVPNLSNSQVNNATEYVNMLSAYSYPADFFESLIYDRQNTDKWSWIVDDYIALENSFQGISKSNGVEFRLSYEAGSNTDIFGYVRYILPNSDASNKDVKRGYIFDAINDTQLTIQNYEELLANDTYIMNFADLNGGNPISNGKSVELIQVENFEENPVYITKIIDIDGLKIGYLMYNGFTSNYDQQMNAAFAQLKSEGATELILDLRYNGGGSIRTSVYLASMITGQFNGELFAKERWNSEVQEWFEANHPDWLVNNFTDRIYNTDSEGNVILSEGINHLNLSKIYFITSGSSASASELVINGLKPYIDVITIGTRTHGKYTGSVTLYDSDDFTKGGTNLNLNHKWALQPIVLETVNKLGNNVKDGIEATHEFIEYIDEMQELGNETEPLLAKTIEVITGLSGRTIQSDKTHLDFEKVFDSKDAKRFGNDMYVDKKTFYLVRE